MQNVMSVSQMTLLTLNILARKCAHFTTAESALKHDFMSKKLGNTPSRRLSTFAFKMPRFPTPAALNNPL
jgi:hypothetical protein